MDRFKVLPLLLCVAACATTPCCRNRGREATKANACVREVLVGVDALCVLVNKDYYLCRGNHDQGALGTGQTELAPPEYRGFDHSWVAMPHQFSKLQLGNRIA